MSLLFRQTAPSICCYYGDVISIGDIIDTMVGYHNRPNHHNYHYLTQRNIHNAINIASVPVCSQHAHDGLCGGANGVELYTGEACEAIILLFLSFCPSLCLSVFRVRLSVCVSAGPLVLWSFIWLPYSLLCTPFPSPLSLCHVSSPFLSFSYVIFFLLLPLFLFPLSSSPYLLHTRPRKDSKSVSN